MRKAILPVPLITKGSKISMPLREQGLYMTAVWRVILMPDLVSPIFTIGCMMCLHYFSFSVISYERYFIVSGIVEFKYFRALFFFNTPYYYICCPCVCLFVHIFNLIFVISIQCKIHYQHEHWFICRKITEGDNFSCFFCIFQYLILSWVLVLPFPLYPFVINQVPLAFYMVPDILPLFLLGLPILIL